MSTAAAALTRMRLLRANLRARYTRLGGVAEGRLIIEMPPDVRRQLKRVAMRTVLVRGRPRGGVPPRGNFRRGFAQPQQSLGRSKGPSSRITRRLSA